MSDGKQAPQNIQDAFLNTVRREKTAVVVYLLNGAKLTGRIRSFDKFSVLLESGSQDVLKRMRKGINFDKTRRALELSKSLGIKNWAYFIIGMPGETVETIDDTIAFAKSLPLTLALFHIAVPYPGTPFYYEAVQNGWINASRWEDFDMDHSTVLNYPHLSADELEYHAKRAFRAWALRPGPAS